MEGMLMLISTGMATAIGEQVGREYSAAIQYDLISAYFERQALPQLTALYREQATEERFHGKKMLDYVTEAGGVIEIPAIEKQKQQIYQQLMAQAFQEQLQFWLSQKRKDAIIQINKI